MVEQDNSPSDDLAAGPEPAANANAAARTRASWRPLALAYIAFFGFLMGLMGAVSLLGHPEDGSPSVTLKLTSLSPKADTAMPLSFHERRELNGNLVADPA